jgi:ADP-heptose:LPS heptosyltransferase
MWSEKDSQGFEVRKVRRRIISYLDGIGLDLGAGEEKILPSAIGIDVGGKGADIKTNLNSPDGLRMFTDNSMDYVFSSHCLEDFPAPETVLPEWWRVLRPGGYIILYGPDPDFYPHVGTHGCNLSHKRDLFWEDVWKMIEPLPGAELVHHSRHNDSNEYSWLLVARKKMAYLTNPIDALIHRRAPASMSAFPRMRKAPKECLVIRYGAIGDAVWMTPVLRQLKKDGYYVVYNCTDYSAAVLQHCPWIDEFLIQGKDDIPNSDLKEYWEVITKGFDRVVNMCGSIEGTLLKCEGTGEYEWPHEKRHRECNVNYMDQTCKWAGYPELKGQLPELHFTEQEEFLAQQFRDTIADSFFVLWSLSGSSLHKAWPWSPFVVGDLVHRHNDIRVMTVGDESCQMIEPSIPPNTIPKAGRLTVRQSMILTKYADVVVGPETGILNAASCYDTPKVVFLSHSSPTNLTKYWTNTTALQARNCPCTPCHRLIYSGACPKGEMAGASLCAENLKPKVVYDAIMEVYRAWQYKRQLKLTEEKKAVAV